MKNVYLNVTGIQNLLATSVWVNGGWWRSVGMWEPCRQSRFVISAGTGQESLIDREIRRCGSVGQNFPRRKTNKQQIPQYAAECEMEKCRMRLPVS